jgi:hypothetical protein
MKRSVVSGFGLSVLVLAVALAGCDDSDSGPKDARGGTSGRDGAAGTGGRGGTGGSTTGGTGGTSTTGGTGGTSTTGGTGGTSTTGGTGGSSTGGTGGTSTTGGTGGGTGGTGGSTSDAADAADDSPADAPADGADAGTDAPSDVAEDAGDVAQADTSDVAGDTPDGPPAQALMVIGAVPEASDLEIQSRLMTKLTVDVVPEASVTADFATGRKLVIITATASLAGTGSKFADVTVPVLVMEPNLFGPMGMTADNAINRGTTSGGNQVTISSAAGSAPLTAGLTGNVTVYNTPYRIVWGIPAAAAIIGATIVGTPTQAAVFAYPSGAMMVGRTAPGKRAGFYIHNNTVANVAPDGFKLLDATVDWLVAP